MGGVHIDAQAPNQTNQTGVSGNGAWVLICICSFLPIGTALEFLVSRAGIEPMPPCSGNAKAWPLNCQGIPSVLVFFKSFSVRGEIFNFRSDSDCQIHTEALLDHPPWGVTHLVLLSSSTSFLIPLQWLLPSVTIAFVWVFPSPLTRM